MKIAISALGDSLESIASLDFCRAPYFIIYEIEKDNYESMPNLYSDIKRSVGVQVAQFLVDKGVKIVISDGFDPWVYQFFKFYGVELFKALPIKVREIVERFRLGELKRWEPELGSFFKTFFASFYPPFGWFFSWGSPFDWKTMRIAQLEAMINALEAQIALLKRELENLKREER
ncbi:MAG: hypothetical protein N3C62_03735 [Synergistetes bacterium]|nr:hypothetical protein [Synergistota bacterium]MCX8127838.1 hypothetical protein [Synergistota bacterium]MDW8192100.1 NifB/NifX family molybdenum-iron cluster-binding protein [Synergistota bacterium]